MFEESPVMSPYLLAFVVSDFDYSSLKDGRILHRIFARPDNDAVLRTQFALKNSDLFLKELERYVGFRYELSKVDQIALPDFASGSFCLKTFEIYVDTHMLLKVSETIKDKIFCF
jgi:aminopeptidase N